MRPPVTERCVYSPPMLPTTHTPCPFLFSFPSFFSAILQCQQRVEEIVCFAPQRVPSAPSAGRLLSLSSAVGSNWDTRRKSVQCARRIGFIILLGAHQILAV